MELNDALKQEIIARLKPLKPEKVILFGSYAYGEPHEDSDIDLLVVTNDETIPGSYREHIQNYLRVAAALRDIRKIVPIDVIVHTKAMYAKFLELGSLFSKEIVSKGIVWL